MQYNFICIEGNIGVGKTSLAKKISEDCNARLILEEFANNPFLPNFYKEPEKYAFPLELFFMAERYKQLKGVKEQEIFSDFTVSDYFFIKSRLFAQNNLSADELTLFYRLFDIMLTSLPKPDLLVYLHADIKSLQANIKKRGGLSYECYKLYPGAVMVGVHSEVQEAVIFVDKDKEDRITDFIYIEGLNRSHVWPSSLYKAQFDIRMNEK